MEASKVTLSNAEHQLITDANIILTKNNIIEKVGQLFASMANTCQSKCLKLKAVHPTIFDVLPKISKGEKYEGLPWLMLDYPRTFDKKIGHLAIRTFFWWGNYFSIQLQVSGEYLQGVLSSLSCWNNKDKQWLVGLTTNAWDLNLPNITWIDLQEADANLDYTELTLKVAKKIPINEWEFFEILCPEYFEDLVELITISLSAQPVK